MTVERSEVGRLRHQIEQEEEAMRLGLSGPAIMARHELINARAERAAAYILWLVEQGRHEEACALMEQPAWGENEEEDEHLWPHRVTGTCSEKGNIGP